jgi:hypothetical protein
MWTRSDILALLQLLTMIVLAAIHAVWYLILQSKDPLNLRYGAAY